MSALTTRELVTALDARSPGLAARVDARLDALALARRVRTLRERR